MITTIPPFMRGNTRIRQAVSDFILSEMALSVPDAREAWGLEDYQLKQPVAFLGDDPYQVTNYPALGVYMTGTANFTNVEQTRFGASDYVYDAEVTLFVATSTAYIDTSDAGVDNYEKPYRESAMRQRDDLLTLMREAMFRKPSLGTEDNEDFFLTFSRAGWRETYHDPIKISGERNPVWSCSAAGLTTIRVQENLKQQTYGPVATQFITTTVLE